MTLDCFDFYLWSVGRLKLSEEVESELLILRKEENEYAIFRCDRR
jgi:hypothetical protein